jgi:hypothetical protein
MTQEGGGSGGGDKSYDGEKAWSSINHSILFGLNIEFKLSVKMGGMEGEGGTPLLTPHTTLTHVWSCSTVQ